jgi:hypothetical protein
VTQTIPGELRELVTSRAGERCEYCQLAQAGQEASFHVDHVVPRRSNGPTLASNLALACVGCSLRKAAKESGIDPASGNSVALFNPRSSKWSDHFNFAGYEIVGDTATGRATIVALGMNRPMLVAIREEQASLGRGPDAPSEDGG